MMNPSPAAAATEGTSNNYNPTAASGAALAAEIGEILKVEWHIKTNKLSLESSTFIRVVHEQPRQTKWREGK